MASLATDMEQLSVQDNEDMHLQKFKALNLKAKDSIKLHWDNTTADVSKQKVYDAKFTKLYTPTKTLGYRVGVSYANRGGKETIIIGDFIKRLANTEEVAKNNALRSNNELAKKKKIEEKKAKKASKAEAEKAELKSLKDAKNKGKATIEMFKLYDDDDFWFRDKMPMIWDHIMELLNNEFTAKPNYSGWDLNDTWPAHLLSNSEQKDFYYGFFDNNFRTKKSVLKHYEENTKKYGEDWYLDYSYSEGNTYMLYHGKSVKNSVENPICKVSGEPIEDDEIVVVVSRLPPCAEQDEKAIEEQNGNWKVADLKYYDKHNDTYHTLWEKDEDKDCYRNGGDYTKIIDSVISSNWKFQTFVKFKHLTKRSKTFLLKRSLPPINILNVWQKIDKTIGELEESLGESIAN